MIIGSPSVFAIESGITKAYQNLSIRALGFFVIHVGGRSYGVNKPDATMLACSVDAIRRRLAKRGKHTAPFAAELDPGKIADAFRNAIYAEDSDESFFDIPLVEFRRFFDSTANDLMWAPDGDEAFDDGSYVLQFDIKDLVRLIAFKSGDSYGHDPGSLSDIFLPADVFYEVLRQWRDAFDAEWAITLKSTQSD